MLSVNEKIVALNKKRLETMLQLAQIAVESGEKLASLNLEAAKMLLREGVTSGRTLASAKDAGGLAGWQNGLAPASADKILGYSRNVYEITLKASAEVGELMEQSLLSSSQEVLDWVEMALKASPVGQSEAAVSGAKAAMANAKAMIEGISTAAKQAAEYADANVKAAATATAEAVKGAAK
jgi:phasin family protein